MRQWKSFAMVALLVAALGLAGCGGGGGGSTATEQEPTPMPDPAIAQRAAVNTAINTARTVVAGLTDDASDAAVGSADAAVAAAKQAVMDASALDAGEMAAFNTAIAVIEDNLGTKKTSIMAAREAADDAMMAAMAKTGKALHAALGPPDSGTPLNALSNATATLSSTGLSVDAVTGAGALATDAGDPTAVVLKAGDSAGSLGGWSGTSYAHTDSGTKVVNEAVVYTNQGAPKSVTFAAAGHTVEASGENRGYLITVTPANAMASAFTHSGTQSHPIPERSDALYVRGTYDGAPGEFRCTGTCTSTNDGTGSPSALGGTWHFKPDAGAMVSQPDANYLYFGWWVSKDKDGGPTAASAFAGVVGTITALANDPSSAIAGNATYSGKAAGKFAMSNPLDGTGDGGHFTADATLTAKFGANDAPNNGGVSGTIDNFMANGKSVPWSVELKRGGWGASGAITAPAGGGTVWSIDGNKASASGTWSGQMYDEMPGDPPGGDGSDIPTTVTGTFYSEFSSIGRMVGGFGANKQ